MKYIVIERRDPLYDGKCFECDTRFVYSANELHDVSDTSISFLKSLSWSDWKVVDCPCCGSEILADTDTDNITDYSKLPLRIKIVDRMRRLFIKRRKGCKMK